MSPSRGTRLTDFELTWTDGGLPGPDADWLSVTVPLGVHEALLAHGRIEHPYAGSHDGDLDWVEASTWWYRTRFDARAGERATLRFACLDTVAEIRLNGRHVASARNQHRPHEVDVTLGTHNELLVELPPPLEATREETDVHADIEAVRARQAVVRPEDPPAAEAEIVLRATRSRLRKATFSWGWDFAPAVPSRGILGEVRLSSAPEPLADLHVRTIDLDVASGSCVLRVTACIEGADEVTVEVVAPTGAVAAAQTVAADGEVEVLLPMREVQLWWTHDLGEPALYTVRVTARSRGEVVGRRSLRHGFRTVELDRSPDPDEDARLFRFVVNGVSTFTRGACWVPPSMLVGSIPDRTTVELVRLAREAGMTMLRVWGGGVYPADAFYDACDEQGILVWQDFMFACFDYPDPTGGLAAETALEAAHQVRRLRHHASLALWCGENEVQAIHELVHGSRLPRGRGQELFHDVLPGQVAGLDPDRAYWPGSPWSERDDEVLNGTRDGDRHAWEVWHGNDVGAGGRTDYATRGDARHFRRYEDDRGRFISEFGIHASPELSTLTRWSAGERLDLWSPALLHRIRDTPKDKGLELMRVETGEPTILREYVDFSMAVQAEGLKHGVEHYRRRQPHCGGTLVWQLNDSWPGTSWSVVDYDLVPKAAYYVLQRAFQPLLASFAVDDDGLCLWVSNAGRTAVPLDLTIDVSGLDGRAEHSEGLHVVAEPYSSQPVWRRAQAPDPHAVAWVSERLGRLPANRRFFAPLKDLPLRDGRLGATVLDAGEGWLTVELQSHGYCYLGRLHSDLPGARFSSNYLDLRDGERHTVEVTGIPAGARLSVASYGRSGQRVHVP